MHMFLRTLLTFLKKPFLSRLGFNDKSVITMRVLPTDLDLYWHMNNGVYFSLMDFGRWDMTFRNGIYDSCRKNGWYPVVAGETIKFKKSLELWNKFELITENMGYDERYFYIQQKFVCKGQLMATGLIKIRFLRAKGGTVSPNEIIDHFPQHKIENRAQDLSSEWFGIESKYMV